MIILHATVFQSLESVEEAYYRNGTSAHFLVLFSVPSEEKYIICHVDPHKNKAFHAGLSCWGGLKNLNSCSLGIECLNPICVEEGKSYGSQWEIPLPIAGDPHLWFPYSDPRQVEFIALLTLDQQKEFSVQRWMVATHADIAPGANAIPDLCSPTELCTKTTVRDSFQKIGK
jgi:N-acetylmuramoyl-L-alanine amidase